MSGHLVCLYTANRAWLCNASAGEIIELPLPPPPLKMVQQQSTPRAYNSKSPLKATPPIYSYDLLFREFDEFVIGNQFPSTSLIGKDSKLRIYSYAEDIRLLNLSISNSFGD
ncbi:hypothetical protein RHMOL_Rhmol01G0318800 [Rhododendron molle]|uniref:Uncharacterized protein n=1 Tax=Rhododendron molle TaxID=49168 RepID=A0ACC0Q9U3_RHOML|nr:hypothetical protein RHMOL_Rhmol01G0318800 [Rhododendron molle]